MVEPYSPTNRIRAKKHCLQSLRLTWGFSFITTQKMKFFGQCNIFTGICLPTGGYMQKAGSVCPGQCLPGECLPRWVSAQGCLPPNSPILGTLPKKDRLLRCMLVNYRSTTVNLNTVNLNFHLIRSYCEIFSIIFLHISCLKFTVNSNFHLIRSKTLLTNDFKLTVPDL